MHLGNDKESFCLLPVVKLVVLAAERKKKVCCQICIFKGHVMRKQKFHLHVNDLTDHSKKLEYYQFLRMMW